MGIFLHTVIFLDCSEPAARAAVAEAAKDAEWNLNADECRYLPYAKGVSALLSDMCCGYEPLAKLFSELVQKPVMLLYIYDDDYWGYHFYDSGRELDSYCAWPDAWEEIDEAEWRRLKGRAEVLASYFGTGAADLAGYLTVWNEATADGSAGPAYPGDEFLPGDCWQMTDFMRKLGFPYEWA